MQHNIPQPYSTMLSCRSTICKWSLLALMVLVSTIDAAEPTPSPPINSRSRPKVSPSTFTRDMPFSQAIEILRHSTKRPLNIVVYWKEIADNAGITHETPIGVDGIAGLTVRQHLEVLLGSLSATSSAKLGFVVNRGVIVIATEDRLPKPRKITRVYDVSDLVAPPSRAFGPGMMGGFGPGMGFNGPMGMGGLGQYGNLRSQPGMIRSTRGPNRRR